MTSLCSGDNVTLFAYAAVDPAVQQSIDISCPPGPQHQRRAAAE